MEKIKNIMMRVIVLLIKIYRFLISPLLGQTCRFYPSCSTYSETAFKERGLMLGFLLSLKRILSCHPWHPGGIDPVPKQRLQKP